MITIKDNKLNREDLINYLNNKGVGTRLLFGGNILKQPYFINNNIKYRTINNLKNTNRIMNKTFWIGIYPNLKKVHLDYVYKLFKEYLENKV
jgi:CDP-6-deoxy-D-xylo-4-hexulose-3-dehydrase